MGAGGTAIRDDSPRDMWEISEKGRQWLTTQK
jgi:hypothetical protein